MDILHRFALVVHWSSFVIGLGFGSVMLIYGFIPSSDDMTKLVSVIEDADDIRGTLTKFMWSNCKACHSNYREEH